MNSKTKNDIAWEKIFSQFKILKELESKEYYLISSEQIKEFREPRLMTKFDHKKNLPSIFKQNNLSVLPITRGTYLLSHFDAYFDFEELNKEIIYLDFPENIESIDYTNITSEAIAIHCAYLCGIFNDFLNEDELLPTFSGRMSSGLFRFEIWNHKSSQNVCIDVENSQIEIDAGYEALNSLIIIEAKNSISSDFLIRQLFYPYKLWSNKTSKKIRLIFMIYTNGVFNLFEYNFTDPNNYNSIKLIKQANYSVEYINIQMNDIEELLKNKDYVEEPKLPFPQANSFIRLINLLELLNEKIQLNREEIANNYDFDIRQTNYYADAGRYLGLIDKKYKDKQVVYFLTKKGNNLFGLNIKARQLKLVALILKHTGFKEVLKLYLHKLEPPNTNEVVSIMKQSNLYNISSDSTYRRRAQTVLAWVSWILDLTNTDLSNLPQTDG